VGDVEAAVYFCCLEAVQNACKHAGDGVRIEIELVVAPDHLRFGVHDDGVGFDTSVHPVEGTGLVNMADRLGAVGGRVEVASASGCGTQVSGWLPLPAGTVPGAAVAR
jgi:signal transduction histidine kinase